MTKLDAYSFKTDALSLIFNYLKNRKQKEKINSSFSFFQNTISGNPQDSVLGPLLTFFLQMLFYPNKILNYDEDNTPYRMGDS